MNLQLDDVGLFLRIVELGSLSAAARERDMPVSQVTRSLARLEAACQVRLLHRTTHGLSLTDEGEGFLLHARRLTATAAELQGEFSDKLGGPSGWVRVSVSAVLAQALIAPSLAGLYQRHPHLHLDIAADDRAVDMAREGIDIAVRSGVPAADHLVARPIGVLTRSLYAAPAYAERHGLPAHPGELGRHRLIANSASPSLNRWTPREGSDAAEIVVNGHTRTDSTAVVLALAVGGAGIARIADLVARPLVRSGALLPVLPQHFADAPAPMVAVMLHERHRLPKIRACIDYWAEWIAQALAV